MKIRSLLAGILSLMLFFSFAQTATVNKPDGTWKFTQYGKNILKISFTPKGYTTTEKISDAVIAKPAPSISIKYKFDKGVLFVGDKVALSFLTMDNGYQGWNIDLQPDEKIYGGGERALPLNRRGYAFNLYNNPWYGYSEGADNLNYSVPFFTSSNGYGLFFDNTSRGKVDIGKTDKNSFQAGFFSGEINVFVILGKEVKDVLTAYHSLTGTQPVPPRWALGNFMSRFGYSSQEQTESILAAMQKENIPVDAIIFDLFWFGDSIKKTMGNLDWVNKTKWPDPDNMIAGFKKQHINTILITEPFILNTSANYDASKQYHAVDSTGKPYVLQDFYFGQGGIMDIFRKDAKEWFWQKHKAQMNKGVEAWWGDLGEPEKHPADIYHNLKDFGYDRLFKADEVHNIYGHYWTKMLFDKYAVEYPNKRLFSLNRSGFAGSQRYGIFPWSGDVSRSWSGLRAQLPLMLGMSMSGVPYIHADAGGFAGGDGEGELYVRWLQFAAFTPIFRPHGTALYEIDKAAFSFPSEPALVDEPYRSLAKEAVKLRYKMLPYNYTLSYLQAAKAEPLVSPLYYNFPKDTDAANITNEYMWGKNILVAPVLEKGATNVNVYLPKETKWYSLLSGEVTSVDFGTYSGKTELGVALQNIPLFVKAGSFIPMINKPNAKNTTECETDSLVVHYYSSNKPSSDVMYDDDGTDKNALLNKQYELITFKATPGKTLQFTMGSTGGIKKKRHITLVVHGKIRVDQIAVINGKKTKITIPYFGRETGPGDLYQFSFDYSGLPLKIEIR